MLENVLTSTTGTRSSDVISSTSSDMEPLMDDMSNPITSTGTQETTPQITQEFTSQTTQEITQETAQETTQETTQEDTSEPVAESTLDYTLDPNIKFGYNVVIGKSANPTNPPENITPEPANVSELIENCKLRCNSKPNCKGFEYSAQYSKCILLDDDVTKENLNTNCDRDVFIRNKDPEKNIIDTARSDGFNTVYITQNRAVDSIDQDGHQQCAWLNETGKNLHGKYKEIRIGGNTWGSDSQDPNKDACFMKCHQNDIPGMSKCIAVGKYPGNYNCRFYYELDPSGKYRSSSNDHKVWTKVNSFYEARPYI